MKLYIPTTTLNFNNLMSTESISPASFYTLRKFGIKRFNKVEPNNLNNSILLYTKLPLFSINKDGLDNYPLIIEIDSKILPENTVVHELKDLSIYQCVSTIYFDAFNTKFIFFDDTHRRICLSRSEQSIESKLTSLYKNSLTFYTEAGYPNNFIWKKSTDDVLSDVLDKNISKHIAIDSAIDKIKGFAYSYIIGANSSLSIELAKIKQTAKDIQNIVSAIVTSPNGVATKNQTESLNFVVSVFIDEFEKIDEEKKQLKDYINLQIQKYDGLKSEQLINFLKDQGLYNQYINGIASKFGIQTYDIENEIKKVVLSKFENKLNDFNNKLNEVITRLQKSYIKNRIKTDIKQAFSIPNFKIIEINDQNFPAKKTTFFQLLANEYTSEAYIGKDFAIDRLQVALMGGKILKDLTVSHKEWEGSNEQKYINSLLDSIQNYTPFDIKAHENIVLQSFAAFILKGEDIEKLESFLIQNSVTDFRVAFGLFGSFFGFAELPKTFTNNLFDSNDKLYLSSVYQEIYKQIHKIEITGLFTEPKLNPSPIISNPISTKKPFSISISSKINFKDENKKVTESALENNFIADAVLAELQKDIKKISKSTLKKISELIQKHHAFNADFFEDLYKIKKIESIIDWFETKYKKNIKFDESSSKTESIFSSDINAKKAIYNVDNKLFKDNEIAKTFYLDSEAWIYIQSLIPKKEQVYVKTQLDWIQKSHREGGYKSSKDGKFIPYEDKSNENVINFFYNLINKQINNRKCNISLDINENVKKTLLKIYCS